MNHIDRKFTVKDLVNAGVFSLLVFVSMFIGGMIGFMPVLMPLVPFAASLLSGPVFMLYSTKIKTPGMVMILGILISLGFIVTGHGIYILIPMVIFSAIGEVILKKTDYKSVSAARWVYSLMVLSAGGNLYPIYFMRDNWIKQANAQGYSPEFTEKMLSVLPNWSFLPITLLGGVGAFIGCSIGIKMLNKHFKKAGMA